MAFLKNKIKGLYDKFKDFYDDKYGMLITVSWVVLIFCLIVKLFGGNWFELSSENDKFVAFCNFVDNTMWLKMTLACMIYLFTNYFILCILINRKKLDKKIVALFLPLMITKSLISWYVLWVSYVLDVLILVILPLIIGKKWKRVLFGNVLIFAFQVVTILIRNVSFDFNLGNTFIEQTLYQIDYYLMIILFYLYTFKKNKIKKEE